MKTWVRKSLNVGVLSAGFLLISGGAAHADWTTGYNAGLLNGNQFDTTLQLPINVCGNSIAVLGFADASCGGGATAIDTESATTEDWTTGYNAGVANGNQFDTTLQVPVNVSGNAISVLGFSNASSQGGAAAVDGDGWGGGNGRGNGHGRGHGHGGGNGGGNSNGGYGAGSNNGGYTEGTGNRTEDWTSGYNAGLLNGNQFDTTLQVPVNLSGNAISLFGFSSAQSAGGAWAVKGESASTESATTEDWTTGYNAGLLNGNQFDTTLQVPVNVCGNAIAVLGFSSASCGGGAVAVDGDGWGGGNGQGNGGGHGHGHHGNGGGNGGYGDDDADSNGGYGDDDADSNGGYGNGNGNGNSNAYGNAAGNASNMSSHGASASHGKVKTKKEHGRGNGAGTGTANDGGYGNGNNNGGYGNGQNNGGYGNGNGNGGGHGHGHGNGHGNGNGNGGGWSNGGATAVKSSCSDWTTGYNAGLLNGNQFDTTLQVPINISGNAISLFGFSQASSQGGAVAYSC